MDVLKGKKPTKQPTTFDEHIPGTISGNLKDHSGLTQGNEYREFFTSAGVARIRVRVLLTCPATVKTRFMRSIRNQDIEYPTNQPADVDVSANEERVIDIPTHYGEGRGYVGIVAAEDGEVVYCDLLMT